MSRNAQTTKFLSARHNLSAKTDMAAPMEKSECLFLQSVTTTAFTLIATDSISIAAILLYTLSGSLKADLVNELPQLDLGSVQVAKGFQEGKNRLIMMHVDGLFSKDESTVEERRKLEESLSRLAKNKKNEICLISEGRVDEVVTQYSDIQGVRFFGNSGKSLFDPTSGRVHPVLKLPMEEYEVITAAIRETVGQHGYKYKVKTGVNPLEIDVAPGKFEYLPPPGILDLFSLLQAEHKCSQMNMRGTQLFRAYFKHGDNVAYPIDELNEVGMLDGDGARLTPLPRDFRLTVRKEEAGSSHEGMDKANIFSATVIFENNQNNIKQIQLANIQQVNAILKELADISNKEQS